MSAKTTRNTSKSLQQAAAADVARLKTKVTPASKAVASVVDEMCNVSGEACSRIAQRMFAMPLPANFSDLPKKLVEMVEAFGVIASTDMINDGCIVKGKDYELAVILPKMLKQAYNRLAFLLGSKDLEDAGKASSATQASGLAYFDAVDTFDPAVDGLGFDTEGAYMPETIEEGVYDVETILRAQASLSKHEGLSHMVRSFVGDNGETVDMMPSFRAHCALQKRRQAKVELDMAAAEKAGEMYTGWTGFGERTLDGFECYEQVEFHPMSVGIDESLANIERILASAGWTQEMGKELVDRAGKYKAIALVDALYLGNWRKVKSAFRQIGLVHGSSEGQLVLRNVVESPEWEAEQFDAQDRVLRRQEAKAKREQDREDREAAIQRDRDIREMNRMKDEVIREKARMEHEKVLAAMRKEINSIVNPPKPRAPAKPKAKKSSRKTK